MLSGFFNKFWKNTEGSVLVYTAMFGLIAIGGGALAVDIGQIILLKSEMQHRADAGALAGARQLDGQLGAQARASAVATSAMTDSSGVIGGNALSVTSVNFYSELSPLTAAISDADSKYITVTLDTQQVNFLMAPVLGVLTGSSQDSTLVDASATAGGNPRICNAPPLMICDFEETGVGTGLHLPDNFGDMVRLKEPQGGNTQWAPGNFGLLALPDGSIGANDIEGQLAAVEVDECSDYVVETSPGSKTQKVKDGINARFDMPGNPHPYPAPNVIAFPRDEMLIANTSLNRGNGVWDLATYWDDKHGGFAPPGLQGSTVKDFPDGTEASRYQVYLYELGIDFWRAGKKTLFALPDPNPLLYVPVDSSAGIIPVDSGDPTNPYVDGVPTDPLAVASNGADRRIMTIAQLQCIDDDVRGHGTYNASSYIEMFITEPVQDPPEAAIYGEVIRVVTPSNALEFYANVGLLQ